ncbi:SDR family NAD(P)-dependent oxidoreductase [Verminephrobacter eiseniae]|uniref:Short-chain dehydrogenase/reductase SDR n=1 Tax=Verminephrobacter eiseniae (strain EF01-2) TaxID=391735 RepID=A1WPM3_VEREI|nr:SDR family NAD(P)-dependent oxidoreductase [Verminephrobacter eiseniae]ABM59580.1 short-chain dehydrogenase/reductase SDR [Verminephrobacter eiseniae EF01-2]MCW5285099.1 SDR family NAD(P)-dependent oxidoreductase [Verminephrobacter eiseniae]MCW5302807.1 SDR family NAD(P)-dependent oxidoreductase [Verminephrobacter eiseniae]MCW8180192.1 SDR family NAD(P)-dependent oxidoreductase [Verminephrobacter eiseniae]MCW8191466.1 SDR family NAD(P)-dependent oxidoreductase [Verminephrobacter eiseniae]
MDLQLNGKVAFVTGAGQGVGRRICLDLAAEGVRVAVNDLFEERARTVVREIEAIGGQAHAAVADITQEQQVHAAIAAAEQALGPIDILVNNAGVLVERREKGGPAPLFVETDSEGWKRIVDLNVFGMLHCCKAVLPGMRERSHGKIINIMSEAGRAGEARLAVYSGAKAAMLGFAKAIAREHGQHCINVNVIALGAVSHEGIREGALAPTSTPQNNERLSKMLNAYPIARGLQRLACPEDVSGMVCLLASDRAAFVTGQSIGISGGFVMQ